MEITIKFETEKDYNKYLEKFSEIGEEVPNTKWNKLENTLTVKKIERHFMSFREITNIKDRRLWRLNGDPMEQEFANKFRERFNKHDLSFDETLSGLIHGWRSFHQCSVKKNLSWEERNACLTIIEWLGSVGGQHFLKDCGFIKRF